MNSLVDYDSDSDSNTTPEKPHRSLLNLPAPKRAKTGPKQIVVDPVKIDQRVEKEKEPTENEPSRQMSSLASLLPKPKNRKIEKEEELTADDDDTPNSQPKSLPKGLFQKKSKTLGGAARKMFDGDIDPIGHSSSNYDLSENKRIKIVPSSVLAKEYRGAKKAETEKSSVPESSNNSPPVEHGVSEPLLTKKQAPDISNLFAISPGHSVVIGPSSSSSYKPVFVKEEEIKEVAQEVTEQGPELIPDPSKAEKVIEFNADDIYQQNIEMRRTGELEERKVPIRSIGSGRHQLSAVIANAQREQEGLEEKYAQTRKNKQQSRAKYGF